MALTSANAGRLPGLVFWLAALVLTWTGGSLAAQQLYWTASNPGPGYSIRRIDPDGSNLEVDAELGCEESACT